MSEERELLKKILTTGWLNHELSCEVEAVLTQPEQSRCEPVAWMYDWNIKGEDEYGETRYDCLTRAESITSNRAITNIIPLYTSPPKREPLSDEDVLKIATKVCLEDMGLEMNPKDFKGTGVFELSRAIEKAHGITGGGE